MLWINHARPFLLREYLPNLLSPPAMKHQDHAQKSRTETRLSPEDDPEFQIAPMIDILLVLLVFFMSISSTEVLQKNADLQLPMATDAASTRPTHQGQIIVNVLWNEINNTGAIKVDDVTLSRGDQLVAKLREATEANPGTRLLIRADKKVRYEFLKQVMVAAGEAGVGNVTFSVVDREQP